MILYDDTDMIKQNIVKQQIPGGDTLEKLTMIGIFCRALMPIAMKI